jgi:hypothetical protein
LISRSERRDDVSIEGYKGEKDVTELETEKEGAGEEIELEGGEVI